MGSSEGHTTKLKKSSCGGLRQHAQHTLLLQLHAPDPTSIYTTVCLDCCPDLVLLVQATCCKHTQDSAGDQSHHHALPRSPRFTSRGNHVLHTSLLHPRALHTLHHSMQQRVSNTDQLNSRLPPALARTPTNCSAGHGQALCHVGRVQFKHCMPAVGGKCSLPGTCSTTQDCVLTHHPGHPWDTTAAAASAPPLPTLQAHPSGK